jgi:hypothetical protein
VRGDWTDGTAAHLPRRVSLSGFGAKLIDRLRSGGTLRVENISTGEHTSESVAALDAIDARALVSVPLFKHGRLAVNLNVHHSAPRA